MSTKNRILTEASALFADGGFNAVSIRDLAEKVGIKESSIYNHFRSKQELFEATIKHEEELLLERMAGFPGSWQNLDFTDDNNVRSALAVDAALRVALYFHTDESAVRYRRLLSMNPNQSAIVAEKKRKYFHEAPLKLITDIFMASGLDAKMTPKEMEIAALQIYAPVGELMEVKGPMAAREDIRTLMRMFVDSLKID